jgi:hypothetical protein
VLSQPLGGCREHALIRRQQAIWHLDKQRCRVPAVGVRDDPGQPAGAYLSRKRRAIGPPGQGSLGEVGEERSEVVGPRGDLGRQSPHCRHAKPLGAVEPFGTR